MKPAAPRRWEMNRVLERCPTHQASFQMTIVENDSSFIKARTTNQVFLTTPSGSSILELISLVHDLSDVEGPK
jgi:hypothetical protein